MRYTFVGKADKPYNRITNEAEINLGVGKPNGEILHVTKFQKSRYSVNGFIFDKSSANIPIKTCKASKYSVKQNANVPQEATNAERTTANFMDLLETFHLVMEMISESA